MALRPLQIRLCVGSMLHVRVRGLLLAVAVLVSVVLAADSDAQPDSSNLGTTPASSNQGQGIGDPREGPKYASGNAAAKTSNPKVPKADQRKSRRNKKSWLSMMGMGGTDKEGKPKTYATLMPPCAYRPIAECSTIDPCGSGSSCPSFPPRRCSLGFS